MNSLPLISVVMSVYNGEKYLKFAIDSILNQTYRNFEFIIINDGSTDNSLKIINSYSDPRIILLNQENSGLCKALNRGITASKGEFIARMDADDVSYPDRLMRQVEFFNRNPECVVVGANANFIDMEGNYLYRSFCPCEWNEIKKLLPATPFFHSVTMFRRKSFFEAGCYFEDIRQFMEDKILWNRMAKLGQLRNLDEVLLDYRIVPFSITSSKIDVDGFERIAEKIIQTNKIDATDINWINIHRTKKVSSRKKYGWYFLRIGKVYLERNFNRKQAIKMLVKSLIFSPLDTTTWFNLFLTILPRSVILKWKESRGVYQNFC